MKTVDVRERVKLIIKEILNLDNISDNAERRDYEEWDSLAYLSIVSAIEREFGVEIMPENINHFNSIPNIIKEITSGWDNS